MKTKSKPISEREMHPLREEVVDALEAAKNVRASIRRGPKVTRYTITFSVPRGSR